MSKSHFRHLKKVGTETMAELSEVLERSGETLPAPAGEPGTCHSCFHRTTVPPQQHVFPQLVQDLEAAELQGETAVAGGPTAPGSTQAALR